MNRVLPPLSIGNTKPHATITITGQQFVSFCSNTPPPFGLSSYRATTPFGIDVPPVVVNLALDYETGAGPMKQHWMCRFDQPASPGASRCTITN